MHCPKCGYKQASEEMRFCSSCGFLLTGVTELLVNDGVTQTALELPAKNRGSRLGAKIVFFSIFSVPIFFLLAIATDGPAFLFIPAFFFLIGIAQIAYKRIFREELPGFKTGQLPGNGPVYSEPVRLAAPIAGLDPLPPPSITDPTTKLFEQPTVMRGRDTGPADR